MVINVTLGGVLEIIGAVVMTVILIKVLLFVWMMWIWK